MDEDGNVIGVVGGPNANDALLKHLKGLANLEGLSLRSTRDSDAGVRKLQQALRNCTIAH